MSLDSARRNWSNPVVMMGQDQSEVGSLLAKQANWASSQSGTIGTARGPLTGYIIK